MWIAFSLDRATRLRYAVRVSIGRINAVSGKSMDEESSDSGDASLTQDYVVVPGQDWLDGICVSPGVVRQFVAMPRKSLGPLTCASELT
jgi:hypothetical protein